MTLEYVRYMSGHWQWTCPQCGASDVAHRVDEAVKSGVRHQEACNG